MSGTILIPDPRNILLEPEPISRDWVIHGSPKGSSKVVARSRDGLSTLVIWECTAGRFEWHYTRDEILVVVEGEAMVVTPEGEERRFRKGDVVFFRAGSVCTWVVENRIRKVAILKEPLWKPLGVFLSFCNRIQRKIYWQVVKLRRKRIS